jgi:hypothetical protein
MHKAFVGVIMCQQQMLSPLLKDEVRRSVSSSSSSK